MCHPGTGDSHHDVPSVFASGFCFLFRLVWYLLDKGMPSAEWLNILYIKIIENIILKKSRPWPKFLHFSVVSFGTCVWNSSFLIFKSINFARIVMRGEAKSRKSLRRRRGPPHQPGRAVGALGFARSLTVLARCKKHRETLSIHSPMVYIYILCTSIYI